MRYQTEVHVSPDRYVCIQLPSYFPEGRAKLTITVESDEAGPAGHAPGEEADRDDIEWWEEFDEEAGRRP